MNEGAWVLAVIVAASLAGLGGVFYGRSLEREGWERLVIRASNLSPACMRAIDEAGDQINDEMEARSQEP